MDKGLLRFTMYMSTTPEITPLLFLLPSKAWMTILPTTITIVIIQSLIFTSHAHHWSDGMLDRIGEQAQTPLLAWDNLVILDKARQEVTRTICRLI